MRRFKAPTQEQAGALLGMIAVLFGGWVRLLAPWMAGFPVNDGGLFYVMLKALIANGLRIPPAVQYNGMSIPFAYPPLGFYAGAIVAQVFRLDPIAVLRWLPAIVLIGTLPAFYWLAKAVLGTSFKAGLATLMFAFTPRAITWQVMGGGLTRSFGQLFLLLAVLYIYKTFSEFNWKNIALATVFSALVVLSHPEAALQAVGIAILLWLFLARTKQGVLHAVEIGAGTLLFSSVWWLPTILRLGAGTLLSAAQTGLHGLYALAQAFLMNFIDEPLMTIVAVLGVIGFAFELSRRRGLLPAWFFLPFLVEPRSAPTVAMIPLAMLAGQALTDGILPTLAKSASSAGQPAESSPFQSRTVMIFLLFMGIYMLGQTSLYDAQLSHATVTPQSRAAFAWVKSNTPLGSRFLVLTGITGLFCDGTEEWFPALTERTSITTIQGKEWMSGPGFRRLVTSSQLMQGCVGLSHPLECVERLTSQSPGANAFDFLYVQRTTPALTACWPTALNNSAEGLIRDLKQSSKYLQEYESEEAVVFLRR